ncbi:tumor necrosis factor receptor superfamily member 5 isoform X1 [Saccopteryx leptura]|uniref:tumor necrosis factor receptor superfamily member 5 isoform X1 n=1 Tax=Saccopteryx leptura TaxID=249018 RepID=UPI00339C0A53
MVRLPLRCLLLGCLLTIVHPETPNVCRENQYLTKGQCCNMCPPGEKLVNECTEFTETDCSPCSEGEFLETWNRETHCHQHRYCDPNLRLQVKREGTSKTDRTCICDEGQHCASNPCESCSPHSSCPPGFGVQQRATEVSDTICEPCPVGFFSNVSSALEKCHPWTSCEIQGLAEQRAGTNKTDVLCGGVRNRMRALVVIPIVTAVLFIVMLVFACTSESTGKMAKKAGDKVFYVQKKGQDPVETEEDPPGPRSMAPVQETLVGCQPVTQEDGKESRISVQERQ